jgi:hypothetical protein
MFRSLALLAPLTLLAACEIVREDVCGEVPPGGGPPVARTREQELCEIARLRVQSALANDPKLDEMAATHLYDRALGWDSSKTTDALVARIRKDAWPELADAVARAVREAREYSKKPFGDCPDEERCLARGAARGARFAIDDALSFFRQTRPPALRPRTEGSEY